MLYNTGRNLDAVKCFFRSLFGSVSLQEFCLPVSSPFSLILFSPLLSLSAHRRIFFKVKTVKITYVEIKMLSLIQLQLKIMTLMLTE